MLMFMALLMTLPAYTWTREGEVHPLGNGPQTLPTGPESEEVLLP